MTSKEFIERELNNDNGVERICSSIYKDGEGNIYSYGTHYPLVFTVYGYTFINTAGYSNTTSRHINWAWQALDYSPEVIDIKLPSSFRLHRNKPELIKELRNILADQAAEAMIQMDKKKRKNTRVYEVLYNNYKTARKGLERINQAIA